MEVSIPTPTAIIISWKYFLQGKTNYGKIQETTEEVNVNNVIFV